MKLRHTRYTSYYITIYSILYQWRIFGSFYWSLSELVPLVPSNCMINTYLDFHQYLSTDWSWTKFFLECIIVCRQEKRTISLISNWFSKFFQEFSRVMVKVDYKSKLKVLNHIKFIIKKLIIYTSYRTWPGPGSIV